jgi:hypothetical protein
MDYLGLFAAHKMLNGKVTDKLGDSYGSIKDFLIDAQTGKIAMAVLSYGGVLGMGDTTKLIPWEALQLNPNTLDYQISINKSIIDQAPEMDISDVTDRPKLSQLYKHYGVPAYWENMAGFDTTDPVYKEAKANDHQQYEGSHQITQPVMATKHGALEDDNRFNEEVDLDKIQGQKPASHSGE